MKIGSAAPKPGETTYHWRDGAQMGRVATFLARSDLLLDLMGGEIRTPYTRQLAAKAAEQGRYHSAVERGTVAASAVYGAMSAQERGPVPGHYQPGALDVPGFPRQGEGIVDGLFPRGTAVTMPNLPPAVPMTDGVIGKPPISGPPQVR